MRSGRTPRSLTLAGLLAIALSVTAAIADDAHPYIAGGYQEAVFSVSDIDAQAAFYQHVAGWEPFHEGATDPALLEVYDLPTDIRSREILLRNSGTERGYLRLIQFDGVPQVQIRSNAQSWDTGGIFDVNTRVADMAKKFAEFQTNDWQAASDPVEFTFGPFVVVEWLARGPDGIVIAMIERVRPPLEGWPHLRELSRLFNATQVVPDADAAKDFYVDKLGFEVYLEHNAPSEKPEQNVLGLPHNMAVDVARNVYILHPTGTNEGSIEVLSFDGATGTDFSDRAHPPNLGILTLRFPLSDMDGFVRHIRGQGIEVIIPPTDTSLEPYGDVRLMAIRGPGGVWLEFYQTK